MEKEKSQGFVSFETVDQIGTMTIQNGKQNKIPQPDFLDGQVLLNWMERDELKGIIITGAGRYFSNGADLDMIRTHRENSASFYSSLQKGKFLLNTIERLPLVTVAAISGICFGGGWEIALSCQFRIATESAIFAFPESGLGIMPGMAGTFRLPGKIGKSKALEIILSGRTIGAEEALELGLIDRIVPNKTHVPAARAFIDEMTRDRSLRQIRSIVQAVNNTLFLAAEDAQREESILFLDLVQNELLPGETREQS